MESSVMEGEQWSIEPSDVALLETIVGYCNDMESAMARFSIDEKALEIDRDFRALMAFFIQQIGETAKGLSTKYVESHPEIPWKAVMGFRDYIVHAYGKVIPSILWDTIANDVPELKVVCEQFLEAI